MVEKKHIVYDLMLKYNGPLSIENFYEETEKWMREKRLHKELKRKSEQVTSKGRRIEWIIEAWKNFDSDNKEVVRLRALFDNVKELKLKKKGHTLSTNNGDVFIIIEGFLETQLAKRWTEKPLFVFLRTLFDKYIWVILGKYDGNVQEDCYDLHKRLKAFFELYKMKVL